MIKNGATLIAPRQQIKKEKNVNCFFLYLYTSIYILAYLMHLYHDNNRSIVV